jgi:3-phenylpropionate/cinnamic acid dioxygenase small subunit
MSNNDVIASRSSEFGSRVLVSAELHYEINGFLTMEAGLLNHDRLEEWLTMLSDDVIYTMPVRSTVHRAEGAGFDSTMNHYEEDMASLQTRVKRILHSEYAYAENPPSRTRRLVTNVAAYEAGDGVYEVTSSVLLLRAYRDSPNCDVLSGEREDLLRRHADSGLRLARRRVLLDLVSLRTPNLSFFM